MKDFYPIFTFTELKPKKILGCLVLPYCFLSILLLFGKTETIQAQNPLAEINTLPFAFNDTLEVCAGQLIQFSNDSENTADAYQWNFGDSNGGFFNTSIDTLATYTYDNGGAYLVTLTNVCDEADSDSLVVLVSDSFTPEIDCVGTQCPSDIVTYTTNAPCGTVDWFVEGAITWTIHEGDSITVVWDNQSEGTIELYVSDCTDSYCTTPLIETIPIVSSTAEIIGESVVCQNQVETYTVPWLQATFFNWSFATGSQGVILSGQGSNQIKVRWNTVGEQTLHCNYSSSFLGCEGFAETLVDVRPKYSISNFSTPFCVNELISVTASHNAACNWTLSSGTLLSGQGTDEIDVLFDMAGVYTISATPVDTTAFCNDPAMLSTRITIADVPPMPNPIEGKTLICPQQPYLYELESLSDTLVVHWEALNGTVSNNIGLPVVVTWDNEPPYALYAWHETLNEPYCASDTVVLDIMTIDSLTLTGDLSVCAGNSGAYAVAPNLPELFYEWTINPPSAGSIGSGQGTTNIVVNWNITPQ
ncbi:MAG: PKD domain-containing protein, partial [Chitinophagales bacterium]